MSTRTYALTSGILFLLIALGHLLRLIFGWQAVLNGQTIPFWPSWLAVILAGFLAYQGLRVSRKQ